MVDTGQKDVDQGRLVGDGPQEMAIEGAGSNWTRKRDTSNPQLLGEFLDDTDCCLGTIVTG